MAYTVMVVDDSDTIRSVLERTLAMTRLPIEAVIQAKNGRDAMEKLRDNWVDIIFSDINMPEMSGTKLASLMAEHPEYRDIPVIIVSTEGSATRIEELKKMGIKGYLRKPFTPEKIRDIIIKTLGEWND